MIARVVREFSDLKFGLIGFMNRHLAACVIGGVVLFSLLISPLVYYAEKDAEGANITGVMDSIWWGIVTLLTVGYGDRYPVTPLGQLLAALLMTVGVTAVGVLTAKVSMYFLEQTLLNRRGFVDEKQLKGHLIICGWKPEMAGFLYNILEASGGLRSEDIVLVTSVPDEELDSIQADSRLKGIKFVRGEFHSESTLLRCAPSRANKIMILADNTPGVDGKRPTATEADARTIMTAMTLTKIAKETPVVAEIIDTKMDEYLKLANVNEIIYSRDYSRLVLARASIGVGIPNILHELLNGRGKYTLTTKTIPEKFVEKKYSELLQDFQINDPSVSVIGVLENTGNTHSIKTKALKRAQRTSNVSQLVENLRQVKSMSFNRPVFVPTPDYILKEGTMAIVIENDQSVSEDNERTA